ncbi:MAG: tRNA1(Val) (adenine(37)-N6)-methyltransferase [Prevotellamassilia sp.]
MFTFQQFTIDDSRCAMKVGTDGVLLGAWADLSETTRILDLGCGSGLIALMAAQRNPQALVKGVEIDEAAAADAQANVAASPFHERVQITCADALTLSAPSFEADCILSNPPYHEEELLPPEAQRAAARHTGGGGLTLRLCCARSISCFRQSVLMLAFR